MTGTARAVKLNRMTPSENDFTQTCAVHSAEAPAAVGPYSQAVRVGPLLFTSGQIALTAQGQLVEGGVEDQARQVFANLRAVLAAAGTDFSRVVKVTVFLTDMNDFAQLNAVYAEQFSEPYPARSTVEVARLPRDVKVEIELVALVG